MSDAASKPKIGVVGMGHVGKKNKLSIDFRTLGKDLNKGICDVECLNILSLMRLLLYINPWYVGCHLSI